MKFTPFQLGLLAIGSFASIVLLNVLAKYQSNEEFRTQLSAIKPADLIPFRDRLNREEHTEAPSAPVAVADTVETYEDENV